MTAWTLVSDPDAYDWHNAKDHVLVEWDSSRVAAMYSGPPDGFSTDGCSARMLTVGTTVTRGPATTYAFYAADSENYWAVHSTRRVGDLLVQWRSTSDKLYTMTYDATTDTFTRVDVAIPNFGFTPAAGNLGGLIVPIDATTILLIKHGFNYGSSVGKVMFARWGGSAWSFGAVTDTATGVSFGQAGYMDAESITGGALVKMRANTGAVFSYGIITGSYPSAPVVYNSSTTWTGFASFFNREWFPAPQNPGTVYRVLPLNVGTTTPNTAGGSTFDWGLMPLTIVSGEVTEGAIVNIGRSDPHGYYDVAGTQSADGAPWVAWNASTDTTAWRPAATLAVKNMATAATGSFTTADDRGIYADDYSIRTIAAAGDSVLVGFYTNYNQQFGVWQFPGDAPPLVRSYLRTVQRGDGLSGGPPRTVQINSQQGSIRNIGHR